MVAVVGASLAGRTLLPIALIIVDLPRKPSDHYDAGMSRFG